MSNTLIILGLAGTKSLIKIIEKAQKENPKNKKMIICRHTFSVGDKNKAGSISHNQEIEDEENCEKKYYELLKTLRSNGYNIVSFTQGSSYGETYISRYSGVKLGEKSKNFEGNVYSKNPDKEMIKINMELGKIFSKSVNNIKLIIDSFKSTKLRDGYYPSFLHDVKVYFVACNIESLIKKQIIVEEDLYINDTNEVFNYKTNNDDYMINEYIVDPKKITEYSRLFNKWLSKKNKTSRKNIDYISTDPGPGHKKTEGQLTVAQDVDDTVVLDMIPKIGCICLSDETIKLTRTLFVIANFNNKIDKITLFDNKSVKNARKDKTHIHKIKLRDVSYCKKKLKELVKEKML